MSTAEFSNTAMGEATEKIMTIIGSAAGLRDGHPDHLKLALEIALIMVCVHHVTGSYTDCIQSPIFLDHGISATVIPPLLLSAAMELREHLAQGKQSFETAPVWGNIRNDDPRIQQHPLADKARRITVARRTPAPLSRVAVSEGDSAHTPAPSKSGAKPKPKPLSKKTKGAKEAGADMREGSPPPYTSADKGKSKEIAPPESLNEAAPEVNRGRSRAHKKRRKESNTSSPPHRSAAPQQDAAETTTVQVRTQYFLCIEINSWKDQNIQKGQSQSGVGFAE